MIEIALVDDHKLLLSGLLKQFEFVSDIEVKGTFLTGAEAIEFLKFNKVDVLIIDLMMEDFTGITLVKYLTEKLKLNLKIIILSGYYDENIHNYALELGVRAFLKKELSHEELVSYIRSVHNNNSIIPYKITNKIVPKVLTDTEKQVLQLIVSELTNEGIGKELLISKRTVDSHISSICRKLNVTSRVGAVREGIKYGII